MYHGFIVIATICCLQAANAASTKKEEKYTPIKHPEPIQDVNNRYRSDDDDIPDVCKNKGFCTIKPKDYPQELFNSMFKGTKVAPQPTLVTESFGDRAGDPDGRDNCESQISYEPLFRVRSTLGKWHTVIQAPEENYVQKVRLETCKEVDSPCFTDAVILPTVITFCKQKYSVWQFLVSDGNNGTETITAELPICCSCNYKFGAKK